MKTFKILFYAAIAFWLSIGIGICGGIIAGVGACVFRMVTGG